MRDIKISEVRLTEEEIEAAVEVLRSGNLRQGAQCEAFEREFALKVGSRYALTCASKGANLPYWDLGGAKGCTSTSYGRFSSKCPAWRDPHDY